MNQPLVLTAYAFLTQPFAYEAGRWLPPQPKVNGLGKRKALWSIPLSNNAKVTPATREEQALLLAQLMQETKNGVGYDDKKDQTTDGSRNFSNLNLNQDMLVNWGDFDLTPPSQDKPDKDPLAYFNKDEAIPLIKEAALVIMRKVGVDRYLHFTRGGRTGFDQPRNEEEQMFASSIRATAIYLLDDLTRMIDDTRYAHDIKWI